MWAWAGGTSIAADEELPSAVGRDPDAVESVDAELHHVLVIPAGNHPEQLDSLLRRERAERHADEIGPDVDFLRRAFIDSYETGFENQSQNGEHLDALRVGVICL